MDLPPGDYRERKPKGWRWKLPWGHPEDAKLPMVMFWLLVAAFYFLLLSKADEQQMWLMIGAAAFALPAGAMMVLWLRD